MLGDIFADHRKAIQHFERPWPLTPNLVQKREIETLLERLTNVTLGYTAAPEGIFQGQGVVVCGVSLVE